MNTQEKTARGGFTQSLDSFFQISKRGSTIGHEIRGGIVTFFAMAYILVVNPAILSNAIPDDGSITTQGIAAGTALVAGVMTILMGVVANYPLALAAGLGLNAVVAFTLVLGAGLSYGEAMGIIAWEGILIFLLVLTGFREAVFRAVPAALKTAITLGLGLFVALIGLVNAGIVRTGATPVQFGISGSLDGWPALVFVFGLFLMIILYVRGVQGAVLISIISATVLAVIVQAFAHIDRISDTNLTGWGQTVPELKGSPVAVPVFDTLGKVDLFGGFGKLGVVSVILLVFSLMLADFFDTMGTMVAVGAEGNLLDEDGNPPKTRQILIIDSLAAVAGGVGGVSSNTSYVESASGVAEGARTGLASVVTGVLFLLSTFLAPLVELVPTEAASTVLVFVGFLMMTQVTDIDWKSAEVAIPSFMTMAFMPFGYSVSVGIGVGFVTYALIQLVKGKARTVHPLMWLVSVLFIIYFLMGPISSVSPDCSPIAYLSPRRSVAAAGQSYSERTRTNEDRALRLGLVRGGAQDEEDRHVGYVCIVALRQLSVLVRRNVDCIDGHVATACGSRLVRAHGPHRPRFLAGRHRNRLAVPADHPVLRVGGRARGPYPGAASPAVHADWHRRCLSHHGSRRPDGNGAAVASVCSGVCLGNDLRDGYPRASGLRRRTRSA